jgi:hypothetical protein
MALANVPHPLSAEPGTHVLAPEVAYRMEPWYQAYMTALFESDRSKIGEKVRAAQRLMVSRQRQILNQSAVMSEKRALDKAFHALRALQLCLKL